jgi:FMN-dependent NADH-azoreductase
LIKKVSKEAEMARLLYIESSPRKDRSSSVKVARAFVEEYASVHKGDTVDILDLWSTDMPEFKGEVINSKYAIMHGEKLTPEQQQAWSVVERIIKNFIGAEKYVISLPMWNFGIPYKLKHYIDLIVQPGYTFSFSPAEGYKGLVTGKPIALVYARGGAYSEGTGGEGFDLQRRYMEQILGFIGFNDIHSIVVEPTLNVTHDEKAKILESAIAEARVVAANF